MLLQQTDLVVFSLNLGFTIGKRTTEMVTVEIMNENQFQLEYGNFLLLYI